MIILAIETSCDETSVAIVKDGPASERGVKLEILSNIVSSQIEFHKKYGGVVPEIASRKHVEVINAVIQMALEKTKLNFNQIDAIAVTYGPGLVGALLVGISAAKTLAYALNKPLIPVNHLEGHIYANFILNNFQDKNITPKFPFICLMVSGGHTLLVKVLDHGKYEILGRTRDDAVGEAFDKVARFLNLGYPGGPIIDKLAKQGNPQAINFPRSMQEVAHGYDFSFSGIKTAVVNFVSKNKTLPKIEDIAASFQQAIIEVLTEKTIKAAKENNINTITLAGGVSANSGLRDYLTKKAQAENIQVLLPPMELCTDNAAMIGCAAYYKFINNNFQKEFKATASLSL